MLYMHMREHLHLHACTCLSHVVPPPCPAPFSPPPPGPKLAFYSRLSPERTVLASSEPDPALRLALDSLGPRVRIRPQAPPADIIIDQW